MKQKVLDIAKSYIGTQQSDARHKALINQYNAVKPLPVGYPMKYTDDWCAAFVTVIGDLTHTSKYIGRECGVQRFIFIFKNKGIWRGLQKPVAGDIVVFDWQKNGWADHIGFVEEVKGNKITTIEGNTSRHVARKTYSWNDWRIAGYARPKYPISEIKTSNTSIHDLASEVIRGEWGDGEERITRLNNAGYDESAIQKEVNRLMKSKNNQKSNGIIAREVIQGKWGNGDKRKKNLTEAGYNYTTIQKIVNSLI
ncbi:CHAP domain-containing protein [Carnobacteriaceae bacterium 52-44]